MKKSYLIVYVLIISIFGCQKQHISDTYNDCYAKEVTVNGVSIKKYINDFESELIRSKLLKDSSGESYKEFFNEMLNYDYIVLENEYSFIDSITGVKFDGITKCPLAIANHNDFSNSIFGKLSEYMNENNGNHQGFFESKPIDSIFTKKAFEYDYIKHQIFSTLKVYNKDNYKNGAVLCKIDDCPKREESL